MSIEKVNAPREKEVELLVLQRRESAFNLTKEGLSVFSYNHGISVEYCIRMQEPPRGLSV